MNLQASPSMLIAANEFRHVVVAPTYNNGRTLASILDRLSALSLPIIVVNDGCTDGTPALLSERRRRDPDADVSVVVHLRNRGKAAALRSGFDAARKAGFSHAVTIDTDGQLNPEEIPLLLAAAREDPSALVLGSRLDGHGGCPSSHRLGWWMSALGIWLETGRRVLDSQCGLRVYPLRLFDVVGGRAGRYGFEAEIVTRAAWAGAPIAEVPVTCRYFDDGVSHFRPWRDGVRGFVMHAALTLRRLVPWPHTKLAGPGKAAERGSATVADRATGPSTPWLDWIHPAGLWRRLRQDRFEQLLVAAALGIGTFMAAMPLGGWQVFLAVYAAKRLHVHLIPATLGSMLCLSPAGDFINRAAVLIGSLLGRGQWPSAATLDAAAGHPWPLLSQMPMSWPLGAVVTGFFLNWITIPTFVRVFRLIPVRAESPVA